SSSMRGPYPPTRRGAPDATGATESHPCAACHDTTADSGRRVGYVGRSGRRDRRGGATGAAAHRRRGATWPTAGRHGAGRPAAGWVTLAAADDGTGEAAQQVRRPTGGGG